MPFVGNKNVLLIIFSILFFVVVFSENPEVRENNAANITSEGTSVEITSEEFVLKIKEAYANNCISGSRIMMESGDSARYRYEYVLRNGFNKVVSLTMPYRVTWYRYDGKGFIILDGKRTLMEDMMKDLEDVFLEDMEKDLVEIKITEILYSGIPAYYASVYGEDFTYRVIVLKQSMNFIRLEKQTRGKLTVMFYDNLNVGDKENFENQMIWYKEIPLGSTYKTNGEPTATKENASDTSVQLSEKEAIIERFASVINPLLDTYTVLKTEIIEFSDADSMFVTLSSDELENPFVLSIIIYRNNITPVSENLFDKVPENYNHYQKIKENIEVNVIGTHSEEFLKTIADRILKSE